MSRAARLFIATTAVLTGMTIHGSTSGFSGEDLLEGNPWYHEIMTKQAGPLAGFPADVADELAWYDDYVDSYGYNPLWWMNLSQGGGLSRVKASLSMRNQNARLHFDDQVSVLQIQDTWNRYLSGTIAGLIWAMENNDVAAGRAVLGASLHAIQDFYSHSSWVDAPDRRTKTWFDVPVSERMTYPLYTGTYELPDALGVLPHGKIEPICSVLSQPALGGIMDIACNALSPLSNSSICKQWKSCSDGVPIAGVSVGGITLPDSILYFSPPGMALDNTWSSRIGVSVRGINDVTPDQIFAVAVALAQAASAQWLKKVEAIMCRPDIDGAAFWRRVKFDPAMADEIRYAQYENYTKFPYYFLSVGEWPPPVPAPPTPPVYLRVRLATSGDTNSGTDADIVLSGGGKEFLLDYMPGVDSILDAVLAYNDFEAGDDTAYTIGPFDSLPATITLTNRSATVGDVLAALWTSFTTAITDFFQSIGTFFFNLIGGEADHVKSEKRVWSATDLAAIGTSWQPFAVDLNGGSEGDYDVGARIRKVSESSGTAVADNWAEYQLELVNLYCNSESDWDRGSDSDEPFVLAVLVPLPGDVQKYRSAPFSDVDSGENRAINHTFTFRVHRPFGMLALTLSVFESDDESSADRQALLDQMAGDARDESANERESFLSVLGRAIAADWKPSHIRVYAFSRGTTVGTGLVLDQPVNQWVGGRESITFSLNTNAMRYRPVNTPPTLTASTAALMVPEGSIAVNTGEWSDAEGDPVTLSASEGSLQSVGAGGWIWTRPAGSGPAAPVSIRVTATDNEGGVATTDFLLSVTNAAPVIEPMADRMAKEGDTLTFGVTATDPGGDPLSYEWDFDNNGTYEVGPSPANTADYRFSGSGIFPVRARVTDGDGGEAIAQFSVDVANVAPVVLSPGDQETVEGHSSNFGLGRLEDPGADEPWWVDVDWGDGQRERVHMDATGPVALGHEYMDSGAYRVEVTATDKDGASSEMEAFTVAVANQAPVISIEGSNPSVQYSDPIEPVLLKAVDVPADLLTASARWSKGGGAVQNGLPPGLALIADGSGAWRLTGPVLAAPGSYRVALTVSDEDGGESTRETWIGVRAEDAVVRYDGMLEAAPSTLDDSTVLVTLSATIRDISRVTPDVDPSAGEIRNAVVSFVDRASGKVLAADLPLLPESPDDPLTARARIEVPFDLGDLETLDLTIGTIVGSFYERNQPEDDVKVCLKRPPEQQVTGAGILDTVRMTGSMANDIGEKMAFAVRTACGWRETYGMLRLVIPWRRGVLLVQERTIEKIATRLPDGVTTIDSRVLVLDLTRPALPVLIDGAATLRMILTDGDVKGEPDRVGFTLRGREGDLLLSCCGSGGETEPVPFQRGSVTIR